MTAVTARWGPNAVTSPPWSPGTSSSCGRDAAGLRRFSLLLVYVAGALTTSIFVINVVLHKPVIDALLFSLAIAVGITPQLLPAVVSGDTARRHPGLQPAAGRVLRGAGRDGRRAASARISPAAEFPSEHKARNLKGVAPDPGGHALIYSVT
jgi:hypothetical protein